MREKEKTEQRMAIFWRVKIKSQESCDYAFKTIICVQEHRHEFSLAPLTVQKIRKTRQDSMPSLKEN